jgi:hypothetical protein
VLGGKFAGMILEFGASGVASGFGKPTFNFEYTIYAFPDVNKKGLEKYLKNLLIDIILDRKSDPDAKKKLDEAASVGGVVSKIKLPNQFYPEVV